MKAPSIPIASRRRAWSPASSSPASWVSKCTAPCSHHGGDPVAVGGRPTAVWWVGGRPAAVWRVGGTTSGPCALYESGARCNTVHHDTQDLHARRGRRADRDHRHRRVRARPGQPGRLPDRARRARRLGRSHARGALLLGFYPVLSHPHVTYRCGFFGPAERMMLAGGANIELVPGGFRQFAPILRRYNPRVMTRAGGPSPRRRGEPVTPSRRHLRGAAARRQGPGPAPGGGGQPQPAPDLVAGSGLHQHAPARHRRRPDRSDRCALHPAPAATRRHR